MKARLTVARHHPGPWCTAAEKAPVGYGSYYCSQLGTIAARLAPMANCIMPLALHLLKAVLVTTLASSCQIDKSYCYRAVELL